MSTLERAVAIAAEAHAGQVDKAGRPYLLHPLRVLLAVSSDPDGGEPRGSGAACMAAVLHDVVEDSAWTLDGLRAEGFPESVLAAVDALTRRDGEAYEACIGRVAENPVAVRVKLADLADNLDTGRLLRVTERDRVRLARYEAARRRLSLAGGAWGGP